MICFDKVTKTINGAPIIKSLDLYIGAGELFVLIGPSGCGKTTTMKMINRLIEPTSGKITINGEDIAKKIRLCSGGASATSSSRSACSRT